MKDFCNIYESDLKDISIKLENINLKVKFFTKRGERNEKEI